MSDDRSTFEVTRARLEEIVTQVRRKDVSLEQSLDLLEEAVRLVNQCNDLIDQTSFRPAPAQEEPGTEAEAGLTPEVLEAADEPAAEPLDSDAIGEPDTEAVDSAEDRDEASGTAEDAQHEAESDVDVLLEFEDVEFVIEDDERE